MSAGKIVQIIGAVIDVEFPQDAVPKVYDALKVESGLTLEVQQQLGGGVVRCIALGTSDGLKRGLKVENTGNPIQVPVGTKTLGRIMNQSMSKVILARKKIGLSIVQHQAMKNNLTVRNY